MPVLVPLAAFVIAVVRDPRTMRAGVFLVAALMMLGLELVAAAGRGLVAVLPGQEIAAWVVLGVTATVAVSVLVLGVLLVLNGLTVVRREGRSPAHLLSLALGAVILAYLAAAASAVSAEDAQLLVLLMLIALPLGWFGYGLIAYLLWSWVYVVVTTRWGRPVDAVVVLGAGLRNGQATPLLRSRIDRAIQWRDRRVQGDRRPVLVMSGGQGPDEAMPEADAMAAHAVARGVPDREILRERASTTTRENLVLTARLLATRDKVHRVAVVTSNFHAFRAAMLMRDAGLPGYSVGSRTARYYWPTAVLREYAAITRDHLPLNIAGVVICATPLAVSILMALTS